MSFSHFVCISVSNIPPRKFKYGLWKGVYLRLFGIEKFRGKCFLEHFISNFHIFPYNALQTCHFHIFVCISVSNIPPRKFNYGLWKGVYLRLFGIEKFRGKCFLEHFISNFHIFPYNALQTCHFHILYVFPFQIYPPRKFNYGLWKGVYLRLFGIEKFRGKCFLEHFISNFHIFPYNALQTCHFHILYVFPFQNIPPRKFKYGLWKGVYLRLFGIEKFRGKCFLEHFI